LTKGKLGTEWGSMHLDMEKLELDREGRV
jgi:hypothetical protein